MDPYSVKNDTRLKYSYYLPLIGPTGIRFVYQGTYSEDQGTITICNGEICTLWENYPS